MLRGGSAHNNIQPSAVAIAIIKIFDTDGTEEDKNIIGSLEDLETENRDNIVAAINEVNTVKERKVLWENSNITAAFGPQTTNIDLSEYDYFDIIMRRTNSSSRCLTYRVFKNSQSDIHYADWVAGAPTVFIRLCTVTDTGIVWTDCYSKGTTDNAWLIPYKVIGGGRIKS